MSENETPRTDVLIGCHDETAVFVQPTTGYIELVAHARQLERELAAATQRAEKAKVAFLTAYDQAVEQVARALEAEIVEPSLGSNPPIITEYANRLRAAESAKRGAQAALRAFLAIDFAPTFDAKGSGAKRKQDAVNAIRFGEHKSACDAAMALPLEPEGK